MRRYRDLGDIDPQRIKMLDGKEWVPGTTLFFEVDEQEEGPATGKRRRGRPRGTQATLVADHRPVTADDMRFLSAFCQGVDPRQAACTYLAHNLHNDGRSAHGYARQLLARLAARADEHPERDTAVKLVAELQRRLRQAQQPAPRSVDVIALLAGQGATSHEGKVSPPEAAVEGKLSPILKGNCHQPGAPHRADAWQGGPAVGAVPGPAASPAPAPPSLEQFAARFDDGMYSEAELIELYEEEFGTPASAAADVTDAAQPAHAAGDAAPRGATVEPGATHQPAAGDAPRWQMPVDRRLEILEWLAPRLALPVTPEAPLTAWLEPELARGLREGHGLTTLAQLTSWINVQGSRFYAGVPGLGRERALRLLAWLAGREALTGVALRSSLRALVASRQPDARVPLLTRASELILDDKLAGRISPGPPAVTGEGRALVPAAAPHSVRTGVHALVPLEQLDWPGELAGADGELRSREPTLMKVDGVPVRDDREALQYWLRNVVAGKSAATVRAYRGAIERFVLWAILERKRALSSMSLDDLVVFREFLYQPPSHWCSTARVLRECDEWRPLRGPLAEKAVRQVLDVVKLLYGFWHDQDYLRANPARALKSASSDPAVRQRAVRKPAIDVARSFAREDLQAMQRELADMRDGPAKRRLHAILSLFLDSGVRRAEVEMLTLGQAVPLRDDDNSLSEIHKVSVMGKGERVREVPLLAGTLACLELHYQDRLSLVKAGTLPEHFGQIAREQTPVLSVLRVQAGRARERRGLTPASAPRVPSFDGRLDNKTLYGILKVFFKKVGQRSDLVRGHADFERASTHWLRHTFALQFLAANPGDLPALQGLLGHEDLSTTGIYVRAALGHRARGVARMERFFEAPEMPPAEAGGKTAA
jgi:site-specific recombinase XerD